MPRTSLVLVDLDTGLFMCSAMQLPDEVDCSTYKGITSERPIPRQRAGANYAVQLGFELATSHFVVLLSVTKSLTVGITIQLLAKPTRNKQTK